MISFELSPEEAELQRSTHRFAEEQMRPLARRCEEDGGVAQTLVDTFWDLGLAQLGLPERLGGIEVGIGTAVVVEEELAWGDAGITVGMRRPGCTGAILATLPSSPADVLSTLLRDRDGSATLLAADADEPVVAREDGDGIVVNGTTALVPGCNHATSLLVSCRLAGDRALILLPLRTAGADVALESHQLGLRAAPLGAATLVNCHLSRDHVIATGGAARAAMLHGLERASVLATAGLVGTARAAFEYAAQYAVQRTTFGRPIAEHQAVAFMIADCGIRVDAARALLWHAAWAIDAGAEDRAAAVATAAAFAIEHVVAVTSDAVQILGGHGYIQDHPVEKWMRDARTLANYSAGVTGTVAALRAA
jgi:alkylation response protein AidB-like acyl-CoA dehydrogenase